MCAMPGQALLGRAVLCLARPRLLRLLRSSTAQQRARPRCGPTASRRGCAAQHSTVQLRSGSAWILLPAPRWGRGSCFWPGQLPQPQPRPRRPVVQGQAILAGPGRGQGVGPAPPRVRWSLGAARGGTLRPAAAPTPAPEPEPPCSLRACLGKAGTRPLVLGRLPRRGEGRGPRGSRPRGGGTRWEPLVWVLPAAVHAAWQAHTERGSWAAAPSHATPLGAAGCGRHWALAAA